MEFKHISRGLCLSSGQRKGQLMTISEREKLVSLSANLWHDWLLTLPDEELKKQLIAFNEVSHGVLEATKTLLTAKILLKNKNKSGVLQIC
jgi:hypothetical protein